MSYNHHSKTPKKDYHNVSFIKTYISEMIFEM